MQIETGWRFHTADFSVQAAGNDNATGVVRLVREPTEARRWHKMSEELRESDDGPPLYICRSGMSLEEAITNANIAAAHAKPIVEAAQAGEGIIE